jgi:hypothetical protein
MMARGETVRGAVPRELSVNPKRYVDELRARGFSIDEDLRFTDKTSSA